MSWLKPITFTHAAPPCPRLGAVHDGSSPPPYLGGPGARSCRWEDGYIMSDLRHTEKGFRWSSCSIEQFHHFLKYVSLRRRLEMRPSIVNIFVSVINLI